MPREQASSYLRNSYSSMDSYREIHLSRGIFANVNSISGDTSDKYINKQRIYTFLVDKLGGCSPCGELLVPDHDLAGIVA